MQVQAYLFFEGRCEEAVEFYKKVLGAKVQMMLKYKDSPEKNPEMCPPQNMDKIMHGAITIGDSVVNVSDGMASGKTKFDGFSLTLDFQSPDEVKRIYNDLLGDGGAAALPPTKTFFSPMFAMVKDKFGMHWMLMVPQKM